MQGLLMGAVYALIALSMTLIFSVSGLLNFAHGDFIALAMYCALSLSQLYRLDPYFSAPLLFVLFLILGGVLFLLLIRPVLKGGVLTGAQLTLGLVFVQENLLLLVYGGESQTVTSILANKNLVLSPLVLPWPLIVGSLIAGALAIALYLMLLYSDFGRQIRAIVQQPAAAALMGIPLRRVQTQAFALGIGLLGLTGPIIVPQFTLSPTMGLDLTLLALIVMVLGGIGNFLGSMVGGLIIGMTEGVGGLLLGGNLAAMVPYAVLLLILLFRPHGLFGKE